MVIRRGPLSFRQKCQIYSLRLSLNKSYREMENILKIAKSTIHYNFEAIEAEIKNVEASPLDKTQALVLFVLSGVFEGKMSTRSVESMILMLYGEFISHQTILEILKEAAKIAEDLNGKIDLSFVGAAIFDEIFQGNSPILSMADPISGLIMLKNSIDRSGESWASFIEELKIQGLTPVTVTTDGGSGLLKGLETALPESIVMRDLFHVLYKMSKAKRVMEGFCYSLIKLSYEKPNSRVHEQVIEAIKMFDEFEALLESTRKSCYLSDERGMGYYTTADELNALLVQTNEKMVEFCTKFKDHKAIRSAISYLKNGTKYIISYKIFIEQKVLELFGKVNADIVKRGLLPIVESMMQYQRSYENEEKREYWGQLIGRLRHQLLGYALGTVSEVDSAIAKCWLIVNSAVKSNSYIEPVNSVIRCHLETFKSIPSWFCQLFTFFWNNRVFKRGKRAEKSPLQLYRPDIVSIKSWIDIIMDKFPFDKFRSGISLNSAIPKSEN